MTAFVRAFIFCNACGVPFDSDTVPAARNVTEARRAAKRRGWTRKRGDCDLCEDCGPTEAAPAP